MWELDVYSFATGLDPLDRMVFFTIILSSVLFGLMLYMLVKKIATGRQEKQTDSKRAHYRDLMTRYAHGEEIEDFKTFKKSEKLDIRNIIADVSGDLKGPAFERIQALYRLMGFDVSDERHLKNLDSAKRLRALSRLERMRMEIPYEVHLRLLDDFNDVVRMLAMMLFIKNHKKAATPKLIAFIEKKKYRRKGYLFLMIQEIGQYDRSALSFLFERTNDPDIEEALLISASMCPPPKFDEIIYRKLSKSSAPFVIVWALRVLVHYPTERFFMLADILHTHPFWAVRLEVVKVLHTFPADDVMGIASKLMEDSNYLVRLEATKFVAQTMNTDLINEVLKAKGHPSQSIMRYVLSIDSIKKAA